MYVNERVEDVSVNWEIYKRLVEIETAKGEEGNVNSVPTPKYNPEDKSIKTLVESIALSTTSFFAYKPSSDEVRNFVAKRKGVSASRLPADVDRYKNPDLFKEY